MSGPSNRRLISRLKNVIMLIMKIRLIIKFERTLELEARIYTIRLIMRIRPIIKFERTLELEAKLTCMIRLII